MSLLSNLTSLTHLELVDCENLTKDGFNPHIVFGLKKLVIYNFKELTRRGNDCDDNREANDCDSVTEPSHCGSWRRHGRKAPLLHSSGYTRGGGTQGECNVSRFLLPVGAS
jgi:hypothetical protein